MSGLRTRACWSCRMLLVLGWIVPQLALAAAPDKPAPVLSDQRIEEILARPISVDFDKTPLRDVVRRLEQMLGIPFYLDAKELTAAGVPPDTPLTRKVTGISTRSALSLIFCDVEANWCIHRGGFLMVSTQEGVDKQFVTRVYDVQDLVLSQDEKRQDDPDFESLIDVIQCTVSPSTWQETAGGGGWLRGYQSAGLTVLVLHQTSSVQWEVAQLLSTLRTLRAPVAQTLPSQLKPAPAELPTAIRPPARTSTTVPGEEKVLDALQRRVSLDASNMPLAEVADRLARQLGINVVSHGDGPDGLLRDLKVTFNGPSMRGEAILDVLAGKYDLDWSVQHESIFLSGIPLAPWVTKAYDVRDLTARRTKQGKIVYRAEELIDTLRAAAARWDSAEKVLQVRASPDGATLLLNDTWRLHRQVARLLEKMRAARSAVADIPPAEREPLDAMPPGNRPASRFFSAPQGSVPARPERVEQLIQALEADPLDWKAIAAIEDLGLDAGPAAAHLTRLLDRKGFRGGVMAALGAIGKDAASAVPQLVERLPEGEPARHAKEYPFDDAGVTAAKALGKMGQYAVPYLVSSLTDARSVARSNAALALSLIGPEASSAVPALIGRLKDGDWFVRASAAEALVKISSEPAKLIPVLVKALDDEDLRARCRAAYALGAIRPGTRAAVEALCHMLQDKDIYAQYAAATALGRLGPEATPAVPALTQILKGRRSFAFGEFPQFQHLAEAAAKTLAAIGPPAKSAMPAILEVIGDTADRENQLGILTDNREVRKAAVVAAARVDPQSDRLAKVLLQSLKGDVPVRPKAARALALLGPRATEAVPTLVELLKQDARYSLQYAAATAVIAPDDKGVAELLRDQMPRTVSFDDDDWAMLREAFQKNRAGLRAAIPFLITAAQSRSENQAAAVQSLAVFGSEARAAIPALVDLLGGREQHPRHEAIEALAQIASTASPELLNARKNPNPRIRSGVVEVLGHYAGGLPLVSDSLADPSARVRLVALQTLARLGPRAKPAIAEIRKQLQSDSRTLREAAADALMKIEDGTAARQIDHRAFFPSVAQVRAGHTSRPTFGYSPVNVNAAQ